MHAISCFVSFFTTTRASWPEGIDEIFPWLIRGFITTNRTNTESKCIRESSITHTIFVCVRVSPFCSAFRTVICTILMFFPHSLTLLRFFLVVCRKFVICVYLQNGILLISNSTYRTYHNSTHVFNFLGIPHIPSNWGQRQRPPSPSDNNR